MILAVSKALGYEGPPPGPPVYRMVSWIPFAFGPSNPSGSRYSSLLSFEWDGAERRQKEVGMIYAQVGVFQV